MLRERVIHRAPGGAGGWETPLLGGGFGGRAGALTPKGVQGCPLVGVQGAKPPGQGVRGAKPTREHAHAIAP